VPFSNPIVAGNVLIRDAIQSENYVPATSGWSINRDGSAEFADLSIRGSVDITNPNDPGDNIQIDLINDRPFVWLEFNGHEYTMFVSEASPGVDNQFILSAYPSSQADTDFRLLDDLGGENIISMGGSAGKTLIGNDGFLYRNVAGQNFVKNGWINAPAANGWTGGGGIQYKLLPTGEVIFRGNCSGGTNTVGTAIISALPAAYRMAAGTPGGGGRWVCSGGTATGTGSIQIDTSGNVVIAQIATGAPASFWVAPIRYSVV
jgi:hypothetical protein